MRTLAIVPARGGSKGLPGKNIYPFLGKPLIAHTLEFIARCPFIDEHLVSTDSQEIADVARAYGGNVPGLRPAYLAQDTTPIWDVLRSIVQDRHDDYVILLEPTSPLRDAGDLGRALQLLDSAGEGADGVFGVAPFTYNPYWNAGYLTPDALGRRWYTHLNSQVYQGEFRGRQDVPPTYHMTGEFYIWRRCFISRTHVSYLTSSNHLGYVTSAIRAVTIDTLAQLKAAEFLAPHLDELIALEKALAVSLP